MGKKGFFCGDCKKEIVDFTNKSDIEIAQVLANSKAEVCGILSRNQLKSPVRSELISRFQLAILFVFLFGFSADDVKAQDSIQTPAVVVNQTVEATKVQIEGIVFTQIDSLPAPFVKIRVVQGERTHFAVSNTDGHYCIEFDKDDTEFVDVFFSFLFTDTLVVTKVPTKNGFIKLDAYLYEGESFNFGFIGIIYPTSLLSKDPYEISKTKIGLDDLIHRP